MIRKTLILFAFILTCASTAFAIGGSKTYYSKLAVETSDQAKGKVYVSKSATNTPAYANSASANNSGSSQSHTYYLYAQPADGFVLDYWSFDKTNPKSDVDASKNTYVVNATSENQNSPTDGRTLYAFFKERPPVAVSSNNTSLGTAAITKGTNAIGSSLTVTASFVYTIPSGDYWNCFSKSVKFDGWYDQDGTCRSTEKVYTFTIEEEKLDLEARFHWKPYVTKADGYYRIRSAIGDGYGYINVIADYAPSFSVSNRSLVGAMELVKQPNFKYSDPAVILRIKGNSYADHSNYKAQQAILKNVELIGQGISTKALTNYVFEIRTGDQQGFYKLYYSSANLYNAYNGSITISSDQTGKSGEIMRLWDFEPLDEDHIDEYYFGAQPSEDMFFEGGYWTSMYTAFPYKCWADDGVEAYYITEKGIAESQMDGQPTVITLTKIDDGVVPANTPVLLKCQSTKPEENRLIPLTDDPDIALEKNRLNGELQLNSKNNEKVKFDGNTMRVFSVNSNGVIGFFKLAEGTELAANKAWLDVSNLTPAQAKYMILRTNTTTGVEDVFVEEPTYLDPNAPKYNLMGQPITNPAPGQIYIQNGRKYIAK